jgi:hypothetical protein
MSAHRVTSRPSSFGEISIGAGPLARRATRPKRSQGVRYEVRRAM